MNNNYSSTTTSSASAVVTSTVKENPIPHYEVGYRKPPEKSQFKPGESGNPKGRPSKAKNIKTILENEFSHEVKIITNGKEETISVAEALIKRQIGKGINGNQQSFNSLMKLAQEYLPRSIACKDLSEEESANLEPDLTVTFLHEYMPDPTTKNEPQNTDKKNKKD